MHTYYVQFLDGKNDTKYPYISGEHLDPGVVVLVASPVRVDLSPAIIVEALYNTTGIGVKHLLGVADPTNPQILELLRAYNARKKKAERAAAKKRVREDIALLNKALTARENVLIEDLFLKDPTYADLKGRLDRKQEQLKNLDDPFSLHEGALKFADYSELEKHMAETFGYKPYGTVTGRMSSKGPDPMSGVDLGLGPDVQVFTMTIDPTDPNVTDKIEKAIRERLKI